MPEEVTSKCSPETVMYMYSRNTESSNETGHFLLLLPFILEEYWFAGFCFFISLTITFGFHSSASFMYSLKEKGSKDVQ